MVAGPTSPAGLTARVPAVADRPGWFLVGVFGADRQRLVGYGTVKLDFGYLGAADERLDQPEPGPSVAAEFLPIPGQPTDRHRPPTAFRDRFRDHRGFKSRPPPPN